MKKSKTKKLNVNRINHPERYDPSIPVGRRGKKFSQLSGQEGKQDVSTGMKHPVIDKVPKDMLVAGNKKLLVDAVDTCNAWARRKKNPKIVFNRSQGLYQVLIPR